MIFHAIISLLLIVLVLLQFGKGAEAGLLSRGASDSVFTGLQQGNILSKTTVVISVIFMANSILLAKLQSNRSSKSLLDSETPITKPLSSSAKKKENKSTTLGTKKDEKNPNAEPSKNQGTTDKTNK